jgi:hypothetical protein
MPTTPANKPKAVLVKFDDESAQSITILCKLFRSTVSLKDNAGYIKGTASYCLYGFDVERRQIVVLAESPTASDFNQYVTAKAKADAVLRYPYVVEYRDAGSHSNPKVTMLTWTLSK